MKIVPTILPSSEAEAARALKKHARLSGPIELRIDGLPRPDTGFLRSARRRPVIVTCRSIREGGKSRLSRTNTARVLETAVRDGAGWIDVEQSLGVRAVDRLMKISGRNRVILSYHDPRGTPRGLARRFRAMARRRPAVVKIAFRAASFRDTRRALETLSLARDLRQPACVIAMGEYGTYTRILQGLLGGSLTFAAADPDTPAAPGQLSLEEMSKLYRVSALNTRTKIFGLLGNPVSSSRGVRYHNRIFAKLGANAVYVNFLADDADEFLDLLGSRISGLSVTMPFKTAIARRVEIMEGSALFTGSVNTVVRRSGRLVGSNTDFLALLKVLRRRMSLQGRSMLVLGTGGTAATAAGAGLVSGARVTIAGRSAQKARALAERFSCRWITLDEQPAEKADILVNATSVGMDSPPKEARRPAGIIPSRTLSNYRLVCDFPWPSSGWTELSASARRRGLPVITGADLFSAQAALQSRLFLALR